MVGINVSTCPERAVRRPRLVSSGSRRRPHRGARPRARTRRAGHVRRPPADRRRAHHRNPPPGRPSSTAGRRSSSRRSRASRWPCSPAAPHPADGVELVRARLRIAVRAAWVFAIGAVLEWLDTFVAIILGSTRCCSCWRCRSSAGRPPAARRRRGHRRRGTAAERVPRAGPVGRRRGAALRRGAAGHRHLPGHAVGLAFVLVGLAVGLARPRRTRASGRGWPPPARPPRCSGYAGGWVSTRALAGERPAPPGRRRASPRRWGSGRPPESDRRRAAQRHDLRAGRLGRRSPSW